MKKAVSHILAKLEYQGKREDFKSLTQQGVGWEYSEQRGQINRPSTCITRKVEGNSFIYS